MAKTKTNPKRDTENKEKEQSFQALADTLRQAGLEVRREKLKQGQGWKTVSGVCTVQGRTLIFVDRKNPIEDQLLFLKSVAAKIGSEAGEHR